MAINGLRRLDDLHGRCAFDEFDFIPIRGIDENETAAGGGLRGAICNSYLFGIELLNGGVKVHVTGEGGGILSPSPLHPLRFTSSYCQLAAKTVCTCAGC